MSDTIQIVHWALQQECVLRPGAAATDPGLALSGTADARSFAEGRRGSGEGYGFGVFGDVRVTATTRACAPGRKKRSGPSYPDWGWIISRTFAPLGGIDRVLATCAACPANMSRPDPAGCGGTLYPRDGAAETAALDRIIDRLGLTRQIADTFPATTPIWPAFWIRSPLSSDACRLLALVLAALAEEESGPRSYSDSWVKESAGELRDFVRAAELAADGGLALHVSMTPPGHADCGFHTIFPHCPRCKAEARVRRWQRHVPTELQDCAVCGQRFSPAETAQTRRFDDANESLREQLGPEAFEAFATDYLVARGVARQEAAEIVAATEHHERERLAEIARQRDARQREEAWVRSEIYAGIPIRWHRDEGDPEPGTPAFIADDFAEVLRRAAEKGLNITSMFHFSRSGDHDRYEGGALIATAVFEKWRAEGCQELFTATLRVPDELLR